MFGNLFVQHDEIFSPSQDGDLYLPGIQRKKWQVKWRQGRFDHPRCSWGSLLGRDLGGRQGSFTCTVKPR